MSLDDKGSTQVEIELIHSNCLILWRWFL